MELAGETIAITGVGGFIGARLAALAPERGLRARGLDLDARAVARAQAAGVDARVGDVTDPAAAAWLCDGAAVVAHTAAVVFEDGPMAVFDRVNVGGTRVVAEAVSQARVPCFVHLSSVMVYGFDYPPEVTEDGPYPGRETNPYCVTKLRSEGAAMVAHGGGTRVVIVRPGDVYGAGSIPWVVRPLELMRQGLFVLPDGGGGVFNHVHVDDLVEAMLLAAERDVGGLPINVCDGVPTTFREYFGRLAAHAGLPAPRSLPSVLLRPAFAALATGFQLVGRTPPAAPSALDFLRRPHVYSNARARELLGWAPRVDLAAGIARLSPDGRQDVGAPRARPVGPHIASDDPARARRDDPGTRQDAPRRARP